MTAGHDIHPIGIHSLETTISAYNKRTDSLFSCLKNVENYFTSSGILRPSPRDTDPYLQCISALLLLSFEHDAILMDGSTL